MGPGGVDVAGGAAGCRRRDSLLLELCQQIAVGRTKATAKYLSYTRTAGEAAAAYACRRTGGAGAAILAKDPGCESLILPPGPVC